MGLIYEEPKLKSKEKILLRYGAGYFPRKVLISHGGLLYLTTDRVIFRAHKLDRALSSEEYAVELPISAVKAVGSTPAWRVAMGRRFLRVDGEHRSYLFLFSLRHPRWRSHFIQELRKTAPRAALIDGWGVYEDGGSSH